MKTRYLSCSVIVLVCLALIGCGGQGNNEPENPPKPEVAYYSQEDPDAFYTLDDVEMVGSYLKLDFRDLSDEQINHIIHRLRTELSTCRSGLTIDECLVNRPHCTTALYLAKQVVREARTKT